MLMVLLSFCQDTYPRMMVINGDTVVAVTVRQAKKINRTFAKEEYYRTENDSLEKKIILLETKIENNTITIGNKSFQIDKFENILANEQEFTDELEETLEVVYDELRKEKRKNKFKKWIIGASLGLNAAFIVAKLVQ
jgi:predicted RNase H-like nuclease (RuvC/YqgF family)